MKRKRIQDPSAFYYVGLSRAKELSQIHIVDTFKRGSIRCSADAKTELSRLEKISLNKNPSPWWYEEDRSIYRIATINCRGLLAHVNDLNQDYSLRQATIINLLETSLGKEDDTPATLFPGYSSHYHSVGKGKGIASFVKESQSDIVPAGEMVHGSCQIAKLSTPELDIFAIYKSKTHSNSQLVRSIRNMMDPNKATFVAGDFNVDNSTDDSLSRELTSLGFNSCVHAATHVRGGHLDHAYFRDSNRTWQLTVERISPYYTDHDLLGAVLRRIKE